MLRPVSVHTRVSSHVDCSAEWHNLDACPLHAKSSTLARRRPPAPPPATDRSNFRLPYSTPAVELYPSFGLATHSRERRARTAHLSGAGTATRTRLSFPTTYSHSPAPPHMVKVADQPPLTRGGLAVCHLAAASPGHAHLVPWHLLGEGWQDRQPPRAHRARVEHLPLPRLCLVS